MISAVYAALQSTYCWSQLSETPVTRAIAATEKRSSSNLSTNAAVSAKITFCVAFRGTWSKLSVARMTAMTLLAGVNSAVLDNST